MKQCSLKRDYWAKQFTSTTLNFNKLNGYVAMIIMRLKWPNDFFRFVLNG